MRANHHIGYVLNVFSHRVVVKCFDNGQSYRFHHLAEEKFNLFYNKVSTWIKQGYGYIPVKKNITL